MTEAQFLASDDPAALLQLYTSDDMPWPAKTPAPIVSDRKLRLWVEACRAIAGPTCRRSWELDNPGQLCGALLDWSQPGTSRQAVPMKLRAAVLREIIGNPFRPVQFRTEKGTGFTPYEPWLTPTVLALAQNAYDERSGRKCRRCKGFAAKAPEKDRKHMCGDCRGTGRIEDGTLETDRLLVLADALEEAGCTDLAILDHCRGPGSHVRGCWALDLLLGLS